MTAALYRRLGADMMPPRQIMADRSQHKAFTKALAQARRIVRTQYCTTNLYLTPAGELWPSISEPQDVPTDWLRLASIRPPVDCRPYRMQKMAADYTPPPRQLRAVQ